MLSTEELELLIRRATDNRAALARVPSCGCFQCLRAFPVLQVEEWTEEGPGTALCPHCGAPTLIPDTPDCPVTGVLLADIHEFAFHRAPPPPRTSVPKRFVELLVGLATAAIAALSLWMLWDLQANPPDKGASRLTLLSVTSIVAFLACALFLFAARLAVPALRPEGGRIIGVQGLWAFSLLYGLILVLALWRGEPRAKATGLAVVLGALLFVAWRSTMGPKPPDAAV